jgi:hypothetical protein
MKKTDKFKVGDLVRHDLFEWRGIVVRAGLVAAARYQVVEVCWVCPGPKVTAGSPGTDFPGGEYRTLYQNLEQLACLQKLSES